MPFVLQGISTSYLQSNGQYLDKKGFSELKNKWNVNCIRLSVKTFDKDGYCRLDAESRAELNSKVRWGVQCATECGMYVIIDWHILEDRNPNKYRKYALRFFSKMAAKYKNQDNVIFEICNEPNGDTPWADVKEYAESVAGEIRSQDNQSLIIVGTPEWCRRISDPIDDPVVDLNTAYSYHFYAASHGEENRKDLEYALKAGLPVVVSEFGISRHDGDGKLAKDEGEKWLDLLDQYDVGRICWKLSNGKASCNLIREKCPKTSSWEDDDLSEYGKWIRDQYNRRRWNPLL
jgi:endoglucanase